MLKATDGAVFLFPYIVATTLFVSMFQNLIVLSHDPLARTVPVIFKTTEFTLSLCPYRVAIYVLVSLLQSLIVLSHDPLTRIVPVLLKITERVVKSNRTGLVVMYL